MKAVKTILLIALIAGVLLVVGTCAFKNCTIKKPSPDVPKTEYTVRIKVTGQLYYSDKVTDLAGIVTLYNYYENVNGKYVFKEITLPLDRQIFGDIEVIRN